MSRRSPSPLIKVSVSIASNGIPNHQPGRFPNRNNPNTISAQSYTFRVPVKPEVAAQPTGSRHAFFGVAVNGVPFEPGTAEFWNYDPSTGWVYEAMSGKINLGLDDSNAHVQPTGAYRYHGLPKGLIAGLGGDGEVMRLVGYAAGGFPIYTSYAHSDPMNAASPLKVMRSSYQSESWQPSERVRRASTPMAPSPPTMNTSPAAVIWTSAMAEWASLPSILKAPSTTASRPSFPSSRVSGKARRTTALARGGGGPPSGGRGGPPGAGPQGRGRRPGGGPPGGMRGGSPPNPFEAPPFPPRSSLPDETGTPCAFGAAHALSCFFTAGFLVGRCSGSGTDHAQASRPEGVPEKVTLEPETAVKGERMACCASATSAIQC